VVCSGLRGPLWRAGKLAFLHSPRTATITTKDFDFRKTINPCCDDERCGNVERRERLLPWPWIVWWSQVANCVNRGNLTAVDGTESFAHGFRNKRPHLIRTFHNSSPHDPFWLYELAAGCSRDGASRRTARRRGLGSRLIRASIKNINWVGEKFQSYCNASISRVIVRFKSLSDRRISSILWIECSTVVWCLPPNWRPISGSDAVVSCLTMYMAT
jgi:hypothetical protein